MYNNVILMVNNVFGGIMNYVIVVAHQKGGVGKSTIASNLAVDLAKIYDVEVLDLDMQKSLSYFNTLRTDSAKLNIKYAKNFKEVAAIINNNQKLLIIDVGGFDSDLNRAAILGADLVLTPVSDSTIELVGLLAFKNIIVDIRKERSELQAHVLLNRLHFNLSTSLIDIREFINNNSEFKLLDSIIRDRSEFKKSFERGLSVNEYSKDSKASIEIKALIEEILKWQR